MSKARYTYEIGTEGRRFKWRREKYYFVPTPLGPKATNDYGYQLWLRRKELRKQARSELARLKDEA